VANHLSTRALESTCGRGGAAHAERASAVAMIVTAMKVMTHLPHDLENGVAGPGHATTAESVADVESFAGPFAQLRIAMSPALIPQSLR
jgi:hypothetical protein